MISNVKPFIIIAVVIVIAWLVICPIIAYIDFNYELNKCQNLTSSSSENYDFNYEINLNAEYSENCFYYQNNPLAFLSELAIFYIIGFLLLLLVLFIIFIIFFTIQEVLD